MYDDNNGGPFDSLSEREMQIALMIVGCEKVQSISETLHLSPKTVNTYRYRIFEILNITSDVELALLAVRHEMIAASPDQVGPVPPSTLRPPSRQLQQSRASTGCSMPKGSCSMWARRTT